MTGVQGAIVDALRKFAKDDDLRQATQHSTHSVDCWLWHPRCAMTYAANLIEALGDENQRLIRVQDKANEYLRRSDASVAANDMTRIEFEALRNGARFALCELRKALREMD